MTISSHKPSLLGRKRTKDLQHVLQPDLENSSLSLNNLESSDPLAQVKKTLLDLQSNIFSEASLKSEPKVEIQAQLPMNPTPVSVVPNSTNSTNSTVPKVVAASPQVELKKTAFAADKVSRVTFEQEAFEYLLKFHENLRNPHQAIRVTYSLSEQHRKLLEAMKKVINHYAESLRHSNLNQQEITQKCQALLNTLVSRLSREGVKLKSLTLTPERF